jgi:hypothetical protein
MTWTPTRPSAALRAGASVAVLAASGALLLAACSSSGSSSAGAKPSGSVSAAASTSGNGTNAQAMDKYRQCLTQHGVDLPTFNRPSGSARPSGRPSGGFGGRGGFGGGRFPGFGGASPDAATQQAMQACASLRPQFNGRGGRGGAGSSAFQAFAGCLKDHGVILPTPSPGATNSGRGGAFGGLRALNTSDPKTAKAYDTCKVLLPQRPSGSGAPSASPSAT